MNNLISHDTTSPDVKPITTLTTPDEPTRGHWYAASDVDRCVKALDIALFGPRPATSQPDLSHLVEQVQELAKQFNRALLLGALPLKEHFETTAKDAARYQWLRERYTAVDFDWNESGQSGAIFVADNFPIATADCDATIDAAMGASS